jgi:hypothetical protein
VVTYIQILRSNMRPNRIFQNFHDMNQKLYFAFQRLRKRERVKRLPLAYTVRPDLLIALSAAAPFPARQKEKTPHSNLTKR